MAWHPEVYDTRRHLRALDNVNYEYRKLIERLHKQLQEAASPGPLRVDIAAANKEIFSSLNTRFEPPEALQCPPPPPPQ